MLDAYLLLFTLGWAGFHRYYVGRYLTGVLYTFSFGFLGFGLVYDLIFLSRMVKQTNKKRRERYEENPERHGRKKVEIAQPEWLGTKQTLAFLDLPFQLAFWTVGPIILFMILMMMEQLELMVAVLMIMGISVTIGSVNQLLARRPILKKTPLISNVLNELGKIENYYFENRPRRSIFYFFYPITMWSLIWSKQTRAEMKVLIKPMALVGLILVFNTALGYHATYPPYLGFGDAFLVVFLTTFFVGIFSLAFLVPTISMAMEMNLSGKIQKARRLSFFPLLIIGVIGVAALNGNFVEIGVLPMTRQKERLDKEEYREDLARLGSMFASYEVGLANVQEKTEIHQDELLTSRVQALVAGIAPAKESEYYEAWWVPGKDEGPWLIVLMNDSRDKVEEQTSGEKGGDYLMVAANQQLGTFSSVTTEGFPQHMLDCFTQDSVGHVFCKELDIRQEQTLVDDRD